MRDPLFKNALQHSVSAVTVLIGSWLGSNDKCKIVMCCSLVASTFEKSAALSAVTVFLAGSVCTVYTYRVDCRILCCVVIVQCSGFHSMDQWTINFVTNLQHSVFTLGALGCTVNCTYSTLGCLLVASTTARLQEA